MMKVLVVYSTRRGTTKGIAEQITRTLGILASKPVWLRSSGPLGTASTDREGHDLRAEVPDIAEI
jgi:hypothetical protein